MEREDVHMATSNKLKTSKCSKLIEAQPAVNSAKC